MIGRERNWAVPNKRCWRVFGSHVAVRRVGFSPLLLLIAGIWLQAGAGHAAGVGRQLSGEALFQLACSECHGANATGNGPKAALLHEAVPNLTKIAARRGGRISDEELFRLIDGQADLGANPLREMPVWGYEFFGDDPDDQIAHRQATDRIVRIMKYLRSIQRQ